MATTAARRRTPTRGLPLLALLVAIALTSLSACSFMDRGANDSGADEPEIVEKAEEALVQRYVALGDSFTAAPFVPDSVNAEGCFRSTNNYPALVARAMPQVELVDVSCSGADTTHLSTRQRTPTGGVLPPQLRALTPETDLVTLGIGGNDFNVYGTLIARCPELIPRDPQGAPCRDEIRAGGSDSLLADIERTGRRVTKVLTEIRERSPQARILLVNYPRLTPTRGGCEALPLARGDYRYTLTIATALDRSLRDAVEKADADAELVDLWTASQGHDVCSDEPWVNGAQTDLTRALAYHPFAVGQEAAAELVLETLGAS